MNLDQLLLWLKKIEITVAEDVIEMKNGLDFHRETGLPWTVDHNGMS